MEVIDLNNLETVSINVDQNNSNNSSGVNFGPGIELLMNDKKRNASNNVSIDLGDLNSLENELNELSGAKPATDSTSKVMSGFSNFFGFGGDSSSSQENPSKSVSFAEGETDSKIGSATKDSFVNTKTWDGFTKFNDTGSSSQQQSSAPPSSANMSERDRRRKKRHMIKKLEEWNEKGLIKSNSHFSIDSPYEDIEDEYETAMEDKRKKDSVKLQGWWFMTFVNSVEYANAAFNPFDLNLDGWGEQVSEDIDSYEDIFHELHEKYKGGKLAPELSLLLRLGFSAAVVNFTNKALSTATPGFNDVIRQSPELMKAFTNATVNTMSQQSPGFAFASNLMNKPEEINRSFGPPPAPVETKNQAPPPRPGAMQFTQTPVRQDIQAARGGPMFRESGVEINKNFAPANERPSFERPEMKGPQNTDINQILSGLKTKVVNLQEQQQQPPPQQQQNVKRSEISIYSIQDDDASIVSLSSFRDMNGQQGIPKRTNRRKQKSDKNTISLDI